MNFWHLFGRKISKKGQDRVIFWSSPRNLCILSIFKSLWLEKNGKRGEISKLDKIVYFEKFKRFQQNSYCQSFERCSTLKICQNMPNRLKLKVKKRNFTAVFSFWDLWEDLTGKVILAETPLGLNKVKLFIANFGLS